MSIKKPLRAFAHVLVDSVFETYRRFNASQVGGCYLRFRQQNGIAGITLTFHSIESLPPFASLVGGVPQRWEGGVLWARSHHSNHTNHPLPPSGYSPSCAEGESLTPPILSLPEHVRQ
jgi:hypothetical protein